MSHPSPSPDEAHASTQAHAARSPSDGEREGRAPTLLDQMGGPGGLLASVVPVLVFVIANMLIGLQPAIWSAVGAAVAVALWRLVRREPLQPAVSGILGVALCAFIAYRTGEARGYFLYGIWFSLVAGIALVVSVVVRWPLVGVIWSALNGHGHAWRADPAVRFGYSLATLVWAVFCLARFGVQQWLYGAHETTLLGVARLAMGLPLSAIAALVTIWAIRRAGRLSRDQADQPA